MIRLCGLRVSHPGMRVHPRQINCSERCVLTAVNAGRTYCAVDRHPSGSAKSEYDVRRNGVTPVLASILRRLKDMFRRRGSDLPQHGDGGYRRSVARVDFHSETGPVKAVLPPGDGSLYRKSRPADVLKSCAGVSGILRRRTRNLRGCGSKRPDARNLSLKLCPAPAATHVLPLRFRYKLPAEPALRGTSSVPSESPRRRGPAR